MFERGVLIDDAENVAWEGNKLMILRKDWTDLASWPLTGMSDISVSFMVSVAWGKKKFSWAMNA
jgi:hypothetical protein